VKDLALLEGLLARYVEHHVLHGTRLTVEDLCEGREDLVGPLRDLIEEYRRVEGLLESVPLEREAAPEAPAGEPPSFEGFQTIELLGRGGMGEVYKARDLRLDRLVAAKVLRPDSGPVRAYGDFLREARSMALFQDGRIVQIYEYRPDADPPVILMEFVDGFGLDRVGPSLENRQKARVLKEVCEAVQHAHDLGIQHRDLKPANILLDQSLSPKILDFGLSSGDPTHGHLVGSPPYVAPEQLDPGREIDGRADVYALGVVLYELLCGQRPYQGETDGEVLAAIEEARPPLPVEIEPEVPEPLQAIALKAMEKAPEGRYASPHEMAADLGRYLEGRPVPARPTLYGSVLGARLRPHLEQIQEWLRLKLIYPHEAARLRAAYGRLESREEDWIVQSRVLSWSQIALYLGAFLLVCGGLLYFAAHRLFDAVEGVAQPLLVLGLPFLGINTAAFLLYRREHKAVAIAFCLGGVLLLPLFLLILFHEMGLWAAGPGDVLQFFADGALSNRQLQVALLLALAWASWLAHRTRTVGLSSMATVLVTLFALALLTDFGLREWLEEERWDLLALHLAPLLFVQALAGWLLERWGRPWFGGPFYLGAALLEVAVLELLALDGRAFHYLGLSMARFQAGEVADPVLLDTLAAMAVNGILFYTTARLLERYGTRLMGWASRPLVVISPFATLAPVGWLVHTEEHSPNYDWLYLALALAVAALSHHRQRRSFYFAGLINTGFALWFLTDHRDWFEEPWWPALVIAASLLVLLAGFALSRHERMKGGPGG